MGRRGDGGGSPEGHTKTTTPCAACKLLRRKCAQECPFSPYFSSSEPQKFACVHKIFGASNVSKMLMEVPENRRADVANSLVYEANARIRDPVYGCLGVISALQQQAQALQAELHAVRTQIMRFRFQESAMAAAASAHHHHSTNYNLNSTNNNNIGTPIFSTPLAFKVPASTTTHSPNSCQTTINSNDCYTTIATSDHESTMASVDLKEHYNWSQLHQSC